MGTRVHHATNTSISKRVVGLRLKGLLVNYLCTSIQNINYPPNSSINRSSNIQSKSGRQVVGQVKKVGKSRNFHQKVGKSRNFSAKK